jgi:hypothetical protein
MASGKFGYLKELMVQQVQLAQQVQVLLEILERKETLVLMEILV